MQGDGSFPFLGKIEQRGIQYFIHDHNTQSLMFKLKENRIFRLLQTKSFDRGLCYWKS